jgi:hypothetical protein
MAQMAEEAKPKPTLALEESGESIYVLINIALKNRFTSISRKIKTTFLC